MFTGLVQDIGTVDRVVTGGMTDLWIRTQLGAGELSLGESIAVDGCCLTVVETSRDAFRVQASAESLRRTTLGRYRVGTRVNLERALRLGDRLGGHWVMGHVDDVGTLRARSPEGDAQLLRFDMPAALAPFFIEKGSITIDGVSLTVNTLGPASFEVAIIPETQKRTTLGQKRVGAAVNLEVDVLGKYVARLLGPRAGALSEETLRLAGFGALK